MLRRLLVFMLCLTGGGLQADWRLNPEGSVLSFVTIKNGQVIETHHFNGLNGHVDPTGHAEIKVRLGSIDTANRQRDQRIEEFLFEVADFAQATYAVDVDLSDMTDKLGPGESLKLTLNGVLNLHGITHELPADVVVTRLDNNGYVVSSRKPIVVSAYDFALTRGIEKLRELAGLDSITTMVAVSFSLVFTEFEFRRN